MSGRSIIGEIGLQRWYYSWIEILNVRKKEEEKRIGAGPIPRKRWWSCAQATRAGRQNHGTCQRQGWPVGQPAPWQVSRTNIHEIRHFCFHLLTCHPPFSSYIYIYPRIKLPLYSLTRQFFLSGSVLVTNPELGVSRTESRLSRNLLRLYLPWPQMGRCVCKETCA